MFYRTLNMLLIQYLYQMQSYSSGAGKERLSSLCIKIHDPITNSAFNYSNSTMAMREQCVLSVNGIVLESLLLTLNRFHTLFSWFHCWLGTSKCRLGSSFHCLKTSRWFFILWNTKLKTISGKLKFHETLL